MGIGSFPGVKRPERGADHPPPSSAPRSRESRAIPLPPLWAVESVTGYLYLYMFRALLAHLQEALHKQQLVYILIFRRCWINKNWRLLKMSK
jgi:hypothetical protein